MNPLTRNRQLDVLRGAAILLVLGRHLPEGTTPIQGFIVGLFSFWYRVGWSGVDLFFVLSGFLVSGLLFREYRTEGSVRPGRFYLRRGLRIWPAFYLMIAVSLLFVWRTTRLSQVLIEAFFVQSYFSKGCLWMHTWTLAVEEHFYLIFGALAYFLSKNKTTDPFRLLPLLWLISAGACLWARFNTPYNDPRVFIPTHVRIDALLFGVTLSYFYHFHREALAAFVRRWWILLAASAAALLFPLFRLQLGAEPFLTRFGLTCTYLGYGFILLVCLFVVPLAPKAGPIERGMRFMGLRSYSIYLWHLPVSYLLSQPIATKVGGETGLWAAVAVYFVGSIFLGDICYRRIEKPVLDWRDKRFPVAAKPVDPQIA